MKRPGSVPAHPAARHRGRHGGRPLQAALLPLLLALAACASDEGPRLPPGTPIVLFSIDTLRSDRLPAYGYEGVETPHLDALAADAILYEHAYAHIPLTLPSHVSMLTGLLPPEHGVRDNMGYRLEDTSGVFLPRRLQELGYATGAAVSSFVLRGASGLAEGFDLYEDRLRFGEAVAELGSVQRPGDETLELALDWVRSVRDRSFFLFFHIYEPHTPFEPPEPFASLYESAYDGEVAAADAVLGDLVAALKDLELYDQTLLILVSDHGEGLGDHGYVEHGPFLYREAIQVPLLIKLPNQEQGGTRVAQPVQLVDLAPTVLELLGAEVPAGLPGRNVLREALPPRSIFAETFYPRIHFGWSDLASLVEYPYHLIEGPDPELYDLAADPAETENILRQERRRYAEMRSRLESYRRDLEAPGEVDEETRRRLAALGYVGTVAPEREGPLPDPKDRVHVLDGVREAVSLHQAGRYEEAVAVLRRVLEEEPGLVDAWERLGHSLMKLGRVEEALDAYREGVELTGGAPHVALPAANALLTLGRLDEARAHAELAVDVHPVAHNILARVALSQGDLAEAERQVEAALASRGTRIDPLVIQAELLLEQGRLEEAVAATERAEEEHGDGDPQALQGLFFVRGNAYSRLGRPREAEEAFRREMRISPDSPAPYTHLAILHALEGRAAEAGRTLRNLVERIPTPHAYAEAVRTLRSLGDERSAGAVLRQALARWPDDPELRGLR